MMKRLFFLLTALLTLSMGMWAETQFVTYIDENGVAQTVYSVNVITNSTTTLNAGWYVVTGTDVQTGSLTCNGEVYLILADGAKLTATGGDDYQAGIEVSGEGNSLSIYGQAAQSGRLIATGGESAAGIGGGFNSSGSDIFMPVNYRIKADGTFIHNDGTDLADSLAGKQNVEAYPDGLLNERNAAFAAISAAVEGIADEAILAMAAAGMEDVFQAEGSGDIEASKQKTLSDLQYVISFYNSGKAAGKTEAAAELLGSMGEPCTDCPTWRLRKARRRLNFITRRA